MTSVDELRLRFGALTAEDVAAMDRAAMDGGVSVTQLMEVAGFQVARCAWHMLRGRPGFIVAIVGRGNNGGDGLVAARHLSTWGCTVTAVLLTPRTQLEGLLEAHADSAEASNVSLTETQGSLQDVDDLGGGALTRSALVLDGILGTGLRSAPREPAATVIRELNASGSRVLAIDIPSGMDAATGDLFDPCVRASATCTLAAMKSGLWELDASQAAGEIWVADIGMPLHAWRALGVEPPRDVRGGALLPVPSATPH